TGLPKGVSIEHRSASALIDWAATVFSTEDTEAVLAATSICFDLSVFELFFTLAQGGTIVLAENALELPVLSEAQHISLVNTVPSAMAELIELSGLSDSVRVVNLAGEVLSARLAEGIYSTTSVGKVFNLYGPTEDTTYSTCCVVEKDDRSDPHIGRPITNTQAYILDPHFQPLAESAPGGLYLSGSGLARGYLHRPDLTAERFLPLPFGPGAGQRMYWTGDRARHRRGNIDFLGRFDHQVKVRGFRVELGEIEALIGAQAKVQQAAVVVEENSPSGARLVGYVVGKAGIEEIKEYLKQRLPDYMRPSAYIRLEQMPLNEYGKVDRRRLPRAEEDASSPSTQFKKASTPVEEVLLGIWSELLGSDHIGVDDDFFDAGGHSLLATRLNSRLRDAFKVDLPLRAVFESPSVAGLARSVESLMGNGRRSQSPQIVRVARDQLL